MTGEEDSGFTVHDRRRANTGTDQPVIPDSQTGPDAAANASPITEEPSVDSTSTPDMPRLTMRDRLLMCIDILHQGAWIGMGLVADPSTGLIEKDMAQAQNAIDCVRFLAEKVQGELDEATRRELRNLLSDLQLNYVQQMNR